MGNHEFCIYCHENDFHRGRPCDPKKRAKVLKQEKVAQRNKKAGNIRLKKLQDYLKKLGIRSSIDYGVYGDSLSVYGYDIPKYFFD